MTVPYAEAAMIGDLFCNHETQQQLNPKTGQLDLPLGNLQSFSVIAPYEHGFQGLMVLMDA
jgi:hypothetical protein